MSTERWPAWTDLLHFGLAASPEDRPIAEAEDNPYDDWPEWSQLIVVPPPVDPPPPDELAAAVARGARLLDRRRPGWRGVIDRAELVLWSCARCVLGQLSYDYHVGIWDLAAISATSHPDEAHRWAIDHGFTVDAPETDDPRWDRLRRLWLAELDRAPGEADAAAEGTEGKDDGR